jgi:hypothetical protein
MVDLMRDTGGVIEQINPEKLSSDEAAAAIEMEDHRVDPPVDKKRGSRRKK